MRTEKYFRANPWPIIGLVILTWGLLSTDVASAQISPACDASWSRFAEGGGTRQSTNYQLQDILGQWALQSPAGTHSLIVTDFFWDGDMVTNIRILLPLIIKH